MHERRRRATDNRVGREVALWVAPVVFRTKLQVPERRSLALDEALRKLLRAIPHDERNDIRYDHDAQRSVLARAVLGQREWHRIHELHGRRGERRMGR